MKIHLLEPFLTGSHAAWASEYAAFSHHEIKILGLKGKHWKWRMHGGAVTLARQFLTEGWRPDLLLATDMLDLTTFLTLTREVTCGIPVAIYMHENQLSYPWSPSDVDPGLQRDAHYAFINYSSALAADRVLFNSDYHRNDFLAALPGFLASFPDCNEAQSVQQIAAKSQTLPLGLDLSGLLPYRQQRSSEDRAPLILWNHRWEYDKNPEEFFRALFVLQERGVEFELAVLGESYRRQPAIFTEARQRLAERIVHWGFVESFADYAGWLWRADLLPVTAVHDFFGVSTVQAIFCGCRPLLPDRLAYPEHLPTELHGECLYTGFENLVSRLTRLCRDGVDDHSDLLRSEVEKYAWQRVARRYDECFRELAFQSK